MNLASINPREPANWIVGLSVLIVGLNGIIFRGHELDDGLIYARYIQNLISGNGLVYNAGEYVNGLTSPLFAWLSLAPAYLLGDARHGTMLISVLAAMGAVIVFLPTSDPVPGRAVDCRSRGLAGGRFRHHVHQSGNGNEPFHFHGRTLLLSLFQG